jgi:hypothetical protein
MSSLSLLFFNNSFTVGGGGRLIDEIGAFPAQNVLGSFGYDGLVTQAGGQFGDVVRINQLRISENSGCLSEEGFDTLAVLLYLGFEFVRVGDAAKGVGVRFGQKFHAAGFGQFFETVQHFGAWISSWSRATPEMEKATLKVPLLASIMSSSSWLAGR